MNQFKSNISPSIIYTISDNFLQVFLSFSFEAKYLEKNLLVLLWLKKKNLKLEMIKFFFLSFFYLKTLEVNYYFYGDLMGLKPIYQRVQDYCNYFTRVISNQQCVPISIAIQ